MQKFSLIMPIYGDSFKYMRASIPAIRDQDWDNYEIIVVLDGPNEKARNFIKKEKFGKFIKLYEIEHGGAPAARNYGAEKSTGNYLMFVDPDVYLYAGSLRDYAEVLEDHPEAGFVYGHYDIIGGMQIQARPFNLRALRTTNYISGGSPIRKEIFPGQKVRLKSLQDWDMWLSITDKGHIGHFIDKSFFITEEPGKDKGISLDSSAHWIERRTEVLSLHGIKPKEMVISSLGAPDHGLNAADILDTDFMLMPSWKPHNYKKIYLLGFYPAAANDHFAVFMKNYPQNKYDFPGFVEAKKIIHWIGTDIWQLRRSVGWEQLRGLIKTFKNNGFIHLCEADFTQKELREVGINAKIVPLPPKKLFDPIPLSKKFAVANYINPTQDMYHEGLMHDVAKAMPDIDFYFFGDDNRKNLKDKNIRYVGFIDMEKLFPKISCLTRVTVHDGLPLGPVEAMMAGRNVVTNVPLKYAIPTKVGREEIIKAIRKAQDIPLDDKAPAYWKEKMDHDKFREEIGRL